MQLVFATNNSNKLEEVRHRLPQHKILSMQDIGCFDDIAETGSTFEENARIKALHLQSRFGCDCFADDSGLEIEALNGAPGVFSARYAGKHNDAEAKMAKVLQNMDGKTLRKAKFVTVICLLKEGKEVYFRGEIHGTITSTKKGEKGFGYDPIFLPDGYSTTFAEMTMDDKSKVSHRAIAIEKMTKWLEA